MDNLNAPFEITKASDFTDKQIEEFWIEFKLQQFFKAPSTMPMLILGAKGSGKTHLMRYYSYPLQKLRYAPEIIKGIKKNKYLGIFMRFSGLNPERFKGKKINEDVWKGVFAYFFELWTAQILLNIILDIHESHVNLIKNEKDICVAITELFDVSFNEEVSTLTKLVEVITKLQKQADYAINNSAIIGNLNSIELRVTAGKLIFGIPKILAKYIKEFSSVQFIYLLDEFENIDKNQQKHINTVLRERIDPVNFKIGVRLYGIKTPHSTYTGNEENKEDSEFEYLRLDRILRKSKYKPFFAQMCEKRLEINKAITRSTNQSNTNLQINNSFAKIDQKYILSNIAKKYKNKEKPYFLKLRKKLLNYIEEDVVKVIELLEFNKNPLVERTNIFLFYRAFKEGNNGIVEIAKKINKELEINEQGAPKNQNHIKVLNKFKSDILDQLLSECGYDPIYAGFDILLDLSYGNPRVLITLLKNIVKWSYFYGEEPFKEGALITLKSQAEGIKDASEWFWEYVRIPGERGTIVRNSIIKLAQFFREIRFSDLTPECSLTAFTFDPTKISKEVAETIKLCEEFSYIIQISERKDKNSKNIYPVYQLNRILAPRWDLPIYKRGDIKLTLEETTAIFSESSKNEYENIIKDKRRKYNFPFLKKIVKQSDVSLFDE